MLFFALMMTMPLTAKMGPGAGSDMSGILSPQEFHLLDSLMTEAENIYQHYLETNIPIDQKAVADIYAEMRTIWMDNNVRIYDRAEAMGSDSMHVNRMALIYLFWNTANHIRAIAIPRDTDSLYLVYVSSQEVFVEVLPESIERAQQRLKGPTMFLSIGDIKEYSYRQVWKSSQQSTGMIRFYWHCLPEHLKDIYFFAPM